MIKKVVTAQGVDTIDLPKKAWEEIGLEDAAYVSLAADSAGKQVIIKEAEETVTSAARFIERYRDCLESLAKK